MPGVATGGPFRFSDAQAYDRVLEVNLLGSVRTLRAFLPALVQSKGYGLQIASLAALTPAPMLSAYGTSKTGVEAFTESVRTEVAHLGVDLGVAYLSWTDTDMVRGRRRAREHAPRAGAAAGDGRAHVSARTHRRRPLYGYRPPPRPRVRASRGSASSGPVRGVLTGLLHLGAKRRMHQAEASARGDGPAGPVGLVGAGGRADEEHRGRSVRLP